MRSILIVVCLLGIAQAAQNVQWFDGTLSDHFPVVLCVDVSE
jgi:hypothetical protein